MRYQVTTALTPREALEQALAYFGPGGQGLTVTRRSNLGLFFQGGGGHVSITVQPGGETTLELETREWDYAVRQFMAQMSRGQRWWQRLWRRRRRRETRPPSFTILDNGHDS